MTTFRAAALLVLFGLVAAGCTSGAASSSAPASPTLAPRPSVPASITGTPLVTSQTDTDWGRIWDTLPSTFPTVAGSSPGDETATGPASADLVVDGLDAKAVVTSLETQLKAAGYTTDGLSGPLENGGYSLDMTGAATGCKVRVSTAPAGSLTTLTILYGAGCPHD